jgi:hypothetical protein
LLQYFFFIHFKTYIKKRKLKNRKNYNISKKEKN